MIKAVAVVLAEQVTTQGLDLLSLKVGDRLRVGEALLEVVQIGKPHQNGTVERWHQTWYNHTVTGQEFADLGEVQSTSDHTLEALNTALPSRAKGCGGQPPLQAHPEALIPRRPLSARA